MNRGQRPTTVYNKPETRSYAALIIVVSDGITLSIMTSVTLLGHGPTHAPEVQGEQAMRGMGPLRCDGTRQRQRGLPLPSDISIKNAGTVSYRQL